MKPPSQEALRRAVAILMESVEQENMDLKRQCSRFGSRLECELMMLFTEQP